MDNEPFESGKAEPENDSDQIPEHRAFNLYVILICGLIISLTGVYTKISETDKKPSLYYDGDRFQFGAIDGIYYIVTGIIISIFPACSYTKKIINPAKAIKI